MGKCKYCGKDAGFLKRVHNTCEEEHKKAVVATKDAIANYFMGGTPIQNVLATLQHSLQSYASEEDLFHFDTPLTVAHEMDALRIAGFSQIEILRQWGATTTIRAGRNP